MLAHLTLKHFKLNCMQKLKLEFHAKILFARDGSPI